MATGTVDLDFGTTGAPTTRASVAVTGQAGIVAGSHVEAWLRVVATADHSTDELREFIPLRFYAHSILAGTGFTVEAEVVGGGKTYGAVTAAWAWV